jgi:signal transduction histidine kinase
VDAALAAVVMIAGLLGLALHLYTEPADGVDGLAYLLALLAGVPYLVLHRAPLPVMVAAATVLILQQWRGYSSGLTGLALFVAAFGVAAWRGRRQVVLASLVAVAVLAAISWLSPQFLAPGEIWVNAVMFATALAVGAWARSHRLHAESLAERAELAVRERDQAARRAVAEERVRIAEELHDVVAHSMGVIALQAGVGAHVIDTQPHEAKQALVEISRASRETLGEIRRVLGVLRGPAGTSSHHPAPGLRDVEALAAQLSANGLTVRVQRSGPDLALPAGLDLTAYRIVQEGLTNVLKHARTASADVVIRRCPDRLELEILDDGPATAAAAATPTAGHGLLGMRERVALWGGTLEAGRRPTGGFAVRARLPLGSPGIAS